MITSRGAPDVKADFCNANLANGSVIDAEVAYPAFSRALNATGRPMYFIACYDRWQHGGVPRPGFRPPWEFMHPVANAYRLTGDHHDNWAQLAAEIEMNANAAEHSVHGSFGDFDFLITGGEGCVPPGPPPPGGGPPGGGRPGVRCPNMTQA